MCAKIGGVPLMINLVQNISVKFEGKRLAPKSYKQICLMRSQTERTGQKVPWTK